MNHHDKFLFSFHAADESEKDLERQVDALKNRIDNIVQHVTFEDTPYGQGMRIIEQILRLTPTENELTVLGKALERLAPLRTEHEKKSAQLDMIRKIKADPPAIAALFGDFGGEDLEPEMFGHL